jgi:hypothetical protein
MAKLIVYVLRKKLYPWGEGRALALRQKVRGLQRIPALQRVVFRRREVLQV